MANWLYNGVELPALPEHEPDHNPEVYKYALIVKWVDGCGLFFANTLPTYNEQERKIIIESPYGQSKLFARASLDNSCECWNFDDYKTGADAYIQLTNDMTLLWANCDILNEEGLLYLPASDPINLESKLKILVGESIAYLYNGIQLPKIPEHDPDAYPWAFILRNVGNGRYYSVVCEPFNPMYTTNWRTGEPIISRSFYYHGFDHNVIDGEFVCDHPSTYVPTHLMTLINGDGVVENEIVWSNCEILDADGVVYSSPTEPVPAHEAVIPAPEPLPAYYSYNGHVLPRLPTVSEFKLGEHWPNSLDCWFYGWDIVEMPSIAISKSISDDGEAVYTMFVNLYGFKTRSDNGGLYQINNEDLHYTVFIGTNGTNWEQSTNFVLTDTIYGYPPIWTNQDIYYFDVNSSDYPLTDKLCLAASEPIPVLD